MGGSVFQVPNKVPNITIKESGAQALKPAERQAWRPFAHMGPLATKLMLIGAMAVLPVSANSEDGSAKAEGFVGTAVKCAVTSVQLNREKAEVIKILRAAFPELDEVDLEELRNSKIIVMSEEAFVEEATRRLGSSDYTAMQYFVDGQNVMVFNVNSDDVLKLATIAHEELHGAAGNPGHQFGWSKDAVAKQQGEKLMPKWFVEGATEYLALKAVQKAGLKTQGAAYDLEVLLAAAVEKIVGVDIFRKAYIEQDRKLLRAAFNYRLGKGAFDKILVDSGSVEGAISALFWYMKQNGKPFERFSGMSWEQFVGGTQAKYGLAW